MTSLVANINENTVPKPTHRIIGFWLIMMCAMVFLMVIIGGLTRLTGSGLSMVTWRPITGWLPPLNTIEWKEVFVLYQNSPEYMQNIICSAVGYRINHSRYNKNFWSALRLYESLAKLPHEKLVNYRDERLKHFLIHSQNTVPYYRDLFNKIGFNATDFESLEDLKALPILNKQTIKDNPKAFQSSIIPKNQVVTIHTSGTTGSGFRFETTRHSLQEQWVTFWRHRQQLNIPMNTWCGYFGGLAIVNESQIIPPYWRTNYPGKQILFSACHKNLKIKFLR